MYSFMAANVHKVTSTKGLRIRASASHDSTGIRQRSCLFCGLCARVPRPRDDSFDPEKAPVLSSTRPSKPKVFSRFSKSLLCAVVERTSPVAPSPAECCSLLLTRTQRAIAVLENCVGFAHASRQDIAEPNLSLRGVERRSNLSFGQLEIASGSRPRNDNLPISSRIQTDITFENPYRFGQKETLRHINMPSSGLSAIRYDLDYMIDEPFYLYICPRYQACERVHFSE